LSRHSVPALVACLAALICFSGTNRGAANLEVSFGCIPQAGTGKRSRAVTLCCRSWNHRQPSTISGGL